jgi:hypothetical protein
MPLDSRSWDPAVYRLKSLRVIERLGVEVFLGNARAMQGSYPQGWCDARIVRASCRLRQKETARSHLKRARLSYEWRTDNTD